MLGIIDRFEGDFAVVELYNEKMISINKKYIPKEAKEGYVIDIDEVNKKIIINYEETKKRNDKIKSITKDLWEK
ncbi:Protein of unknown function [Clostridium sp. USBA 49]|uniref:DUF3006 domain-containing protein n=1 Tax=Clostridium sp. USBA 49 TaxID=1881060 RepID=UPI00099AD3AC|nr:DUF3006 domain-containing protein [Clostridium sp. USBA 49]SKA79211.1 Protein of unknown function [Clostridium sp. USBA 49]